MFSYIDTLPFEIKDIIYYYISDDFKSNLTRELFIKNYKNKIKKIPLYHSYVRYIIRNDHHFILNINLTINTNHWFNLKHWKYNNMIFKNYLLYLKYYSRQQSKDKMYQMIKSIETNKIYH